jgi:hypothetical protein
MGEAWDGNWSDELDDWSAAFEREYGSGSGGNRPPDIILRPKQSVVYNDPSRFRVLVAGRRFGKSFLAIPELLRMADGPGKVAWYVAPTRHQAKDDLWRPLKAIAAPWMVGKPNESELSIDLRCGGRIALRSAENYDSLRGGGLDGLVLDEFADIAPEAWTEALRAKLSDRLGRALFIGTPEGRNHFYDLYQRGIAGEPGWASFQFTTLDGGNVTPEEIEAARRELDEKTFRQEYEASFEALFEGAAYYSFDRNGNVRTVEFDRRQPLCWSLDFNVNPMCSVLAQVVDGRVHVLDELILPDSNTREACEEFLERAGKYQKILQGDRYGVVRLPVTVYGDASGESRSSQADKTDWQIVREFFKRNGDRFQAQFKVPSSNPTVKGRITAVNSMLKNHAGDRRLIVDPRCKELIADFERVGWKRDPHGNTLTQLDKSDPKRTHASDALGYLVEKEFGLRQVGGPRSQFLGV